jgi:hypothetical protein
VGVGGCFLAAQPARSGNSNTRQSLFIAINRRVNGPI